VGPRAGLKHVQKRKFLPPLGLELQPIGPPAHSQSLYRLSYPSSLEELKKTIKIQTSMWPGQDQNLEPYHYTNSPDVTLCESHLLVTPDASIAQ
jgi:hypothetical protein